MAAAAFFVVDSELAIHGGASFSRHVLYAGTGPFGLDAHIFAQVILLFLAVIVPAATFWIEGNRRAFPFVATILVVALAAGLARQLSIHARIEAWWKAALIYAWIPTIIAILLTAWAIAAAHQAKAPQCS